MTQKQINAAHRRHMKPSYKGLTTLEKRLVKLREREDDLSRSIDSQWRWIYEHQKPPYDPDITPPYVCDLLSFVLKTVEDLNKVRASKDRLIEKYQLDEDEIATRHMRYNIRSESF